MDQIASLHTPLTTKTRADLADDMFADPRTRQLPIENADHVRAAWDLLDDTHGLSDAEKVEARRRILARAKALGIDTAGWTVSARHAALSIAGDAPEWVLLVPSGTFKGADGRGPYRLEDAGDVARQSMAGGKLPVDENHATDLAAPAGGPSPARAWIVALEARTDGLWGRLEYTQEGEKLVRDGAYRGLSPVFTHDKSGRVLKVLRAALTNTPNLTQLPTLHSETGMDLTRLRATLGLAADADAAAIETAVNALVTQRSAHSTFVGDAAKLLGATADESAVLQALRAREAARIEPGVVTTLQAELASLRAEQARVRAVAIVDKAIAEGKPITPLRDHYIARHAIDANAVEAELAALPSLHAGGLEGRVPLERHAQDTPTREELETAKQMALDPKEIVKTRMARAKKEAA